MGHNKAPSSICRIRPRTNVYASTPRSQGLKSLCIGVLAIRV
nr:MAG TPA: hypothetical protein [Caudoviricetes sp.]